jgi:hypothetical protein
MISIKVFGSGCANCRRLEATVRKVVGEQGSQVEIEEATENADMMKWPILSTPGLS